MSQHFISLYFIIAQEIWHLVRYDTLVTLMFTDYLRSHKNVAWVFCACS